MDSYVWFHQETLANYFRFRNGGVLKIEVSEFSAFCLGGGGSRSICDWTLSSQAFDVGLMAVKGQHNISVTVCTIHWFQAVKQCRLGSGMSEAGSSYAVRTLSQ